MGEPRRYKYTGEAADPDTNFNQSVPQGYLKNKEAMAADYNQTRAHIQTERTRKSRKDAQGNEAALIHPLPNEVPKYSKMEASQINNLRKATTGLINYNESTTFPWSETISASTRLKARHLEEVRQVVDDSKNNARCGDSCSSGCARGCSVTCAAETCKNGCGQACQGGCGQACRVGCGDGCDAGCGKQCKTGCGHGCKDGCGQICSGTCGDGCSGACGAICSSGCGKTCEDNCSNGCSEASYQKDSCNSCGKNCTGDCSATCTGTCTDNCTASCQSGCSGWIW